MGRMRPSPILSIIYTVTIGTKLNNNGGNNVQGLKNVTCKQTLIIYLLYLCLINSSWVLKETAKISIICEHLFDFFGGKSKIISSFLCTNWTHII